MRDHNASQRHQSSHNAPVAALELTTILSAQPIIALMPQALVAGSSISSHVAATPRQIIPQTTPITASVIHIPLGIDQGPKKPDLPLLTIQAIF
jgi:hypothetical protein